MLLVFVQLYSATNQGGTSCLRSLFFRILLLLFFVKMFIIRYWAFTKMSLSTIAIVVTLT